MTRSVSLQLCLDEGAGVGPFFGSGLTGDDSAIGVVNRYVEGLLRDREKAPAEPLRLNLITLSLWK